MHVYHQYTIRVPGHDRDAFVAALAERGVGIGRLLPDPGARAALVRARPGPARDRAGRQRGALAAVHPSLSQADLDTIVEAVNAVAKAGA